MKLRERQRKNSSDFLICHKLSKMYFWQVLKYEYIQMKYVYIGSGPDKKARHKEHLKS